jgi:hypothetical protein
MIVLFCCSEFHMIVLKAEQAARMQMRKDEKREAMECMLVSDFFFFLGSKDICCSECHMIVLLCCSEFYMIVLKAELSARVQSWKDEKRKAKKCMLVSFFLFFIFFYKKIFVALSAT